MQQMNIQKHFSRTVGTTAIKGTGMIVSPVHTQWQSYWNCMPGLTSSLLLPAMHSYMVILVWFPSYMDWECRTKVYNK